MQSIVINGWILSAVLLYSRVTGTILTTIFRRCLQINIFIKFNKYLQNLNLWTTMHYIINMRSYIFSRKNLNFEIWKSTSRTRMIQRMEMHEFDRLYGEYKPRFILIACSYLRDRSAAEDLVTDCFMHFWEKRTLGPDIHRKSVRESDLSGDCSTLWHLGSEGYPWDSTLPETPERGSRRLSSHSRSVISPFPWQIKRDGRNVIMVLYREPTTQAVPCVFLTRISRPYI